MVNSMRKFTDHVPSLDKRAKAIHQAADHKKNRSCHNAIVYSKPSRRHTGRVLGRLTKGDHFIFSFSQFLS